jgi:hypothetical protein
LLAAFPTQVNPPTPHYAPPLVQVKACERVVGVGVPECTFDNPVSPGDLLVRVSIGCWDDVSKSCDPGVDSEGNTWKNAFTLQYYNGQPLDYALNARGGYETIYFQHAWAAIIAEYPPSTGLEDANDGYYGPQNLHPNGHLGSSDDGWARPVITTESCELFIGWGDSGSYDLTHFQNGSIQPIAGPGFTIRAEEYGWLGLEDSVTGTPGLYIAPMSWNTYAHWMMGGVAFKMGGCK